MTKMTEQEFMAQFEAMKKDDLMEYAKSIIGSDYQPTIRQMSSKGKIHQNWKSKPLLLQDLAAFFGIKSYTPILAKTQAAPKAKPVAKKTKAKAPKAKTPTYSTTSSTISRQIKSQKKTFASLKKRPLPALRDIARLQGIPFTNSMSREDLAMNIVMHRATLSPLSSSSSGTISSSSNNSRSTATSSSGKTKSIPTTVKQSTAKKSGSTNSVSSSGKKTKNTATSKRTASKVSFGSKRKPAPKRAKPASTW